MSHLITLFFFTVFFLKLKSFLVNVIWREEEHVVTAPFSAPVSRLTLLAIFPLLFSFSLSYAFSSLALSNFNVILWSPTTSFFIKLCVNVWAAGNSTHINTIFHSRVLLFFSATALCLIATHKLSIFPRQHWKIWIFLLSVGRFSFSGNWKAK